MTFAIAAALPDGKGGYSPAPQLMTAEEAIRYLRIDTLGVKNPDKTLKRYVGLGVLKATRIGGKNFYMQKSCDNFCRAMTKSK